MLNNRIFPEGVRSVCQKGIYGTPIRKDCI